MKQRNGKKSVHRVVSVLVVAAVALLFVTACDDGSSSTTVTGALGETFNLPAGTIEFWADEIGESKTVGVQLLETGDFFVTATVTAEGVFPGVEVIAPPSASLIPVEEFLEEELTFVEDQEWVISDTTARLQLIDELLIEGEQDYFVERYLETDSQDYFVTWVYSDKPVSLSSTAVGAYQGTPFTVTLSMSLAPGWNSVVETSTSGDTYIINFATAPEPAGIGWVLEDD